MKRHLLAAVTCLCLPVAAAGCVVPNARIYYRPSVDGGRIALGHGDPVESKIEFSLADLQIAATSSFRSKERRLVASLILTPTPGHVVRFTSDRFRMHDTEHDADMPVVSILAFNREGPTSPTVPYRTEEHPSAPRAVQALFVDVHVDDTEPASFELLSPPIEIDGVETSFPVVDFERKTWVGLSPFNY